MDPTLEELINGRQAPVALPNVNPQGVAQAGSNMATMGAQPTPVTNPQAQPPATPEEFNARKNGWMQMLDTLRANPAAQQAMMFAAARMLNGPRFGQSQGGAIGEAAFGGMSMYNQLQQNQSDQASQAQKEELERQRTQAQVAESQQRVQESQQRVKTEQFELGEAEKEVPLKGEERELKQRKLGFLKSLANQTAPINPDVLPPMERAWYYEAMKPEFAAELSQARAELARGQVDLATRRLELASQAAEFKKLQEETNKKQRTLLKQVKLDDGSILNTYMNPDNSQTMEKIVPGLPLADAKMQAQQEHDEEFGKPGMLGSRDEKWIANRTAELRRGWIEKEEGGTFVRQDAKAPTGTPAPGAKPKEMSLVELEKRLAEQKPAAPTGGATPITAPPTKSVAKPSGAYSIKTKQVSVGRAGRREVYYVEGDPSRETFVSENNAKIRLQELQRKAGK